MGRKPAGKEPRTERIELRMTKAGKDAVDRLRGEATRSEWLRHLIAQEVKRNG